MKDDSPGQLLLGDRQLGGLEVVDASQSGSESKGFDRCGVRQVDGRSLRPPRWAVADQFTNPPKGWLVEVRVPLIKIGNPVMFRDYRWWHDFLRICFSFHTETWGRWTYFDDCAYFSIALVQPPTSDTTLMVQKFCTSWYGKIFLPLKLTGWNSTSPGGWEWDFFHQPVFLGHLKTLDQPMGLGFPPVIPPHLRFWRPSREWRSPKVSFRKLCCEWPEWGMQKVPTLWQVFFLRNLVGGYYIHIR